MIKDRQGVVLTKLLILIFKQWCVSNLMITQNVNIIIVTISLSNPGNDGMKFVSCFGLPSSYKEKNYVSRLLEYRQASLASSIIINIVTSS